jgi:hypothetical protein
MKERKHYSPEQKVIIVRESLGNNIPISQLVEKYQVHPNDIYTGRKKLFEGAEALQGHELVIIGSQLIVIFCPLIVALTFDGGNGRIVIIGLSVNLFQDKTALARGGRFGGYSEERSYLSFSKFYHISL